MSDTPAPVALTGLETIARPGRYGATDGEPGVALVERQGLAIVGLSARKDRAAALRSAVRDGLGLALPVSPRYEAGSSMAAAWAGPAQWLIVQDDCAGTELEARLRAACHGLAAICDLSDARVVLRLSGPKARDVLAKGLPIDLHPRCFGPGDTALSMFGHLAIHIWQTDERPTYEIAVYRSYASDLWRALVEAGAEFGVAV